MKGHIDDFEDLGTEVSERRVIGGRLHIQSGRNLATKVMSNGVEVIVKGDKTGYIGYGYGNHRTPLIVPMHVSPKPITFPPSTVSRQYHLVETPGKPNLINHLLHSIVRSATPDMVTKTLVTTFTYMTTVLENHSTVVNSREQIISNVVTEKFRPTIEYTPNLKAEPSSIPPYLLESLYSSYLTNTLTTTYTYFNTFTAGTIPIVVTSRETVSNVVTMPAYLATPTMVDMSFHSRVFETETYFTTFTFSKTLAEENSRVVTTMETVTQVVVTEALIPATSPVPLLTPLPQDVSILSRPDITKTLLTTFTYLTTAIESDGQLVTQSRTEIMSEIMTEKQILATPSFLLPNGIHTAKLESDENGFVIITPTPDFDSKEISSTFMEMVPLPSPTLMSMETVEPILSYEVKMTTKKIMEPVLIFATKTYYTTYTYFTTVMGEGGTSIKVNSRTQVASNIVTEALSTAFDIEYVNALKSSYLAKHSTLLEITSTVSQIIPDKTESATLRTPILVTQSVSHPHWPKDEDEGILDATTTSSGSAEHYDEMKEGISHIVHVLSDTQSDEYEIITPSQVMDNLYSTLVTETTTPGLTTMGFEEVTLKEPEETTEGITTEQNPVKLTLSSISHKPTPPLVISPRPSHIPVKLSISNLQSKIYSQMKNPFDDPTLSIVTGPPKSVMYDDDDDLHSHDDDSKPIVDHDVSEFDPTLEEPIYGDMNIGDISSLVDIYVNSVYNKNQLTSKIVVKTEDGLTLFPSILDKFDIGNPTSLLSSRLEAIQSSSSSLGFITKVPASKIKTQIIVDPTQQIFNMLSEITSDGHLPDYYDEVKEEEAFKENYNEASKVYNISTFNPTRRPSSSKTTLKPGFIPMRNITTMSTTKLTTLTKLTTFTLEDTPATKEGTSPAWPFHQTTTTQSPKTTMAVINPSSITTLETSHNNLHNEDTTSTTATTTTEFTTPPPRNITVIITPRITTEKPVTLDQEVQENEGFIVVKQDNIPEEQKDNKEQGVSTSSNHDPFTIKITSDGNMDDSEIVVTFSSKKPEPTRYTTRQPKPKITAKTTRTPIHHEEDDDEIASTTKKIYALAPIRQPGVPSSTSEESNDNDEDQTDDKNSQEVDDKSEIDESDEVADFPSDHRPPPPTGSSGPSKSTLGAAVGPGLVIGGGNTGSQIVSASTSGINWTPLLNLGALGLGGLGASTLTRLGPMFSSVAGYMKSALPLAAGIARNDTHHNHNRNERPYNRVPSSNNNNEGKPFNHMGPNFVRVNPGQSVPFNDAIPRRPIVSHANEPNFRPLSNTRDPDGPFHRLENGIPWSNNNFPPTHNYNFIPPNDAQPNIFSQNVNKHGESQASSSEQLSGPSKIKIVAGSPINTQNQQHSLTGMSSIEEHQDINRRPFFPRPPPRSQDGPPHGLPWGEHIILPLPPHQKEDKDRPGQSRINLSGENRPDKRPLHFNSHELSSAENNFHSRPPSPTPNLNEIRDNGPPKFLLHPHQQQEPRPTPSRSEFISRNPNVQTIHVVRQPTEITILSSTSKKPPESLHHMDKVYYNNVELASGGQNPLLNKPLLTIEIENDDHHHDKPTPETLSHSVTNFDEDKQRPSPFPFPFEHSAESHEHDSFVPPPRFPPTNSLHFLPTPPPMSRPPQQQQGNNNMRPFSSQQTPIFGPMPQQHEPPTHFSKPPPLQMDHSGETNLRPVLVPQNHERRPPFIPLGNPNRPFRHNPQPTPPDGQRPMMSKPHSGQHEHSDENLSHIFEAQSSEHVNRPPHLHPHQNNNNPLFPNQRNPNPERNNGMIQQQQRPFNRPPQASQNRFPGMMGNHPMMLPHFNRPNNNNNNPNSVENNRPFNNNNGPQIFKFPLPTSQEQQQMLNQGPPKHNQLFLPPFNQRPPTSHEHEMSHEFGNFAQPGQKHTILMPSFQNPPWKNMNSQENSQQQNSNENGQQQQQSSLENHRPGPNPTPPRPSTIFIVHESYDVPTKGTTTTTPKDGLIDTTTSRDSIIRRPSTQKLIIKEIPLTTTTPKTTTTQKTTNKATISKLNFIRRFTTPTTTTTTSKPTPSTTTSKLSGFIVSPTVSDILKVNTSQNKNSNRFSGKLPTILSSNKGPVLSKFPFQSTTRKPFDASKHFKNVATNDPNFGQDFSGSENADLIIDPVNEQVIKSPFDSIKPTSFNFPNSTTSTLSTSTSTLSSLNVDPSSSEEQKILETFKIPSGFSLSTPNEFNDLWWPTTFKPKPTTIASVDKNLANHRYSSSTPKDSLNSPTTFRNTVKPTTFRPNQGKVGPNKNQSPIQRDRNQLRRPLNEPSIVSSYDEDEVGIGDIKIKNVEIHKMPDFIKRPNGGSQIKPGASQRFPPNDFTDSFEESGERRPSRPNQNQNHHTDYSEEISEEVKDIGKIRRPLTSSESMIVAHKGNTKPSPSSNEKQNNEKETEDHDDKYDLEKLPYPSTRLRPPAPPPHYNLDPGSPPVRQPQLTAQQVQMQHQSNRPGPLVETISNIFRRPGGRPQQQRPDFLIPQQSPPQQNMLPPPPHQNLAILQNPGPFRPPFPPPHPPGRRPLGPNNNLINRNPILLRPPIRGNNNNNNNNDHKQNGGQDLKPIRSNIIRPPRPQLIPIQQDNSQSNDNNKPTPPPSTHSPSSPTTTTTKRPESSQSQEYSEEQENSNEIFVDNVRSTTSKELIIQNQQKSPDSGEKDKNDVASSVPKPVVSDQVPAAAGDQDASEEYYEDEDEDISVEIKKEQQDKTKQQQFPPPSPPGPPNRPIHAGGYLSNNNFQRPGIRRPGPGFPPGHRPNNEGRPSPPLRTEMEPPPPPQHHPGNRPQRPLTNNNNGPIRFRPSGQPGRNNNNIRPNLLRPDENLFKSSKQPTQPQMTVHTIASVDDDNKIIATNVFTAMVSSRDILRSKFQSEIQPSETLDSAENILITPTTTLDGSESSMSVSSIVKYSSGSLQTSSPYPRPIEHEDDEEDEEEESEEDTIIKPIPSRTMSRSIVRTIIKSTVVRTRGGASSITPMLNSQSSTIIAQSSSPLLIVPSKTLNIISPTSDIKSTTTVNRFVLPSRRPFTKPTPISQTTTVVSEIENEVTEPSTSNSRKPFIPGRNQTYSGFPPWSRRSSTTTSSTTEDNSVVESTSPNSNINRPFNLLNNTRKFVNTRRPFGTTTQKTTTTTGSEIHLNMTLDSNSGKNGQNINSLMKATTFRPFRRPGGFLNALATTTPKIVSPSSTTAQSNKLNEEKDKDTSENRRIIIVNKSPLEPSSSSIPPELESHEDQNNVSITVSNNENEDARNSVHYQINPTRVSQKGKSRTNTGSNQGSSRSKTILSSPSPGREPLTTRFVTFTETLTRTITETESTVFSSFGQPMTHTIMITKTLPPQTLISTIIGTVTLVNSVELKPTTVRTTIYAEPTISIPTFTDTTEQSQRDRDEDEGPIETILQGNIKTVIGGRHKGHKGRLPLTTPTASLTTESSFQESHKKNLKPHGSQHLECISNCGYKGNQVCRRYANGTRSHCVCKPGYARMKNSIPCKPTFTYEMSIALNRMEGMTFDFKDLNNQASDEYQTFVTVTKDALDKAFLSTDVKSKYQGAEVMAVKPRHVKNDKRNTTESQVGIDFLVQLSLNVTEDIIKTQLIRQLKTSNFSVGRGTGIQSTKTMSDFIARDFNECSNSDFNDCSQDADCINIKGSFSCRCRSGFVDKSKKDLPGRDCRVLDGCAECSYHGKCVVDSFGNPSCHCFRWFGGAECQINLKVLLISIIVIGLALFIMVLCCGIIVCRRKKPVVRERTGSGRFLRYRSPTSQATLERTAIMNDSCSSEGSQTPPVRLPPTHHQGHHQSFTPDSLLMEHHDKGLPGQRGSSRDNVNLMNFSLRNVVMDQDRSLTVVIPRAKIRPTSRPPSRPNQSTAMGPDTSADLAASEQKLISYLDQGAFPVPHKNPGRGTASSSRQSIARHDARSFRKLSLQEQRKISTGALVSSGAEVSAQGGMRRRSTGLPIQEGNSNFGSTVNMSTSEARHRSFDDDIVRSPAKQTYSTDQTSRASCYSCKPPSFCAYSESHGHTMAEKDGASTVYGSTAMRAIFRQDSDSNSLSD